MSEFSMTIPSGTTRTFPTAGKYCDKDISITATGGNYDKGVTDGIEAGKQAAYDAFWDSLQQNGNRVSYQSAFGSGWNDENFKPKYDLKPNNANTMFEYSEIVDLKGALERAGVTLDFSGVTNNRLVQMFQGSLIQNVGIVDVTGCAGLASPLGYLFMGGSRLVNIEKWVMTDDGTQKFNETNTFQGCTRLEEIRLEGLLGCSLSFKDCAVLSNASVQSIIDHLKDLTGATAQTLTLHATVGTNLSEEQKAAITAKNWTLVY